MDDRLWNILKLFYFLAKAMKIVPCFFLITGGKTFTPELTDKTSKEYLELCTDVITPVSIVMFISKLSMSEFRLYSLEN